LGFNSIKWDHSKKDGRPKSISTSEVNAIGLIATRSVYVISPKCLVDDLNLRIGISFAIRREFFSWAYLMIYLIFIELIKGS
jgi:hypothetical protein